MNNIGCSPKLITVLGRLSNYANKNCKKYYGFSVVALLYHKKTSLGNPETAYQGLNSIMTSYSI